MMLDDDDQSLSIATSALERADDLLMRGLIADAREEIQRGLRDLGLDPVPDNPHLKVAS